MRAVIFDVDGTLCETERDGHRPAFNRAFADLHLPYRWGVAEYGELLSVTGGQRRLFTYLLRQGHTYDADALAARLHRAKTGYFVDWVMRGPIQARPGVHELLRGLADSGQRLAVATTGTRAWVEPLLARVFADIHFEVVVTGNDVRRLKPHPDAYLVALGQLGLGPEDVAAVEDSLPGVQAALGAQLTCLAVPSAYTDASRFPDEAVTIASFTQIDATALADLHANLHANLHGTLPAGRTRSPSRQPIHPRSQHA